MLALRDLNELLLADRAGPCVSIYLPTHRQHPDNQQDPIRFRNLVSQAAESLRHGRSAGQNASVLAKFHALGDDTEFWNHTTEGLAVFGAPDLIHSVRLQRSMPELAIDQQTERFFRAVDRAVIAHHSKPSGLPLILAALPEYHAPFHSVSHNAQLIASGIEINPEALSIDELRTRAWQVMEPVYLERLAGLVERFGAARASQLGDDRLLQVAEAAAAGRIGTLLVEAQQELPGRLDSNTGSPQADELAHPEVDDLLDDLAELVLRKGGEVVIVPAERMPSTTGLAAIYRY